MKDRRVVGGGSLSGEVRPPGDKSISHRALILGALAEGASEIEGLAPGADVRSTRDCLRALGVEFEEAGARVRVRGRGLGGLSAHGGELDAGNSGTTLRLLAGALAGHPFLSLLTGDASLCRRPMERVADPLRKMGARIELTLAGTAPMSVAGGRLRGIEHKMPVASAQVKSAVLLAGLHAGGRTTVVEPVATRDHTEKMLALFGTAVHRKDAKISVTGGKRLHAARVAVPGDPSSAAFWAVAAATAPDSDILLRGVCANPTRTGFLDVLSRMDARIERVPAGERGGEPAEDLRVTSSRLRGVQVARAEVPGLIDEIPILALAAALAEGPSRFRGLDELRHKESDRLSGVVELLARFGAQARVEGDDLLVSGSARLAGAEIDPRGDHRLALTAYVAGFLAEGTTTVRNAACAEISYPSFYDDFTARSKG